METTIKPNAGHLRWKEKHEARERLNEAAPDLLEAIIACKKALELVPVPSAEFFIELAEIAIRKATITKSPNHRSPITDHRSTD